MASTHGTWNQGNLNWKKRDCFAERVKHHELKSYLPRFDRKWFCLRNVTASTWRLNWPFEKCSSDYRGEFEDRDSHGTGVGVFIFIHLNGCVFVCIWFLLFLFVVAFFDELYWLRVPRVCPKVEKRKTKHTHTPRPNVNQNSVFIPLKFHRCIFFFLFGSVVQAAVQMHRNHYIIMCSPYTVWRERIKKNDHHTKLFFHSDEKKETRM